MGTNGENRPSHSAKAVTNARVNDSPALTAIHRRRERRTARSPGRAATWGRLTAAVILAMVVIAAVPATATAAVAHTDERLLATPSPFTVAYVSDGDIWLLPAGSTSATRLTNTPELWEGRPEWSPNGASITYTTTGPDEGSYQEIWAQPVDGSQEPRVLCSGDGFYCDGPSWSPDGSTIAFSGGWEVDHSGIWTVAADGSAQPILLVAEEGTDLFQPDWSPEGDRLAIGVSGEGGQGIGVVNRDGGGMAMVTGPFQDAEPSWSPAPHGSEIAFSRSNRDNDPDIWVVNVDNGSQHLVTAGIGDEEESPAWDPSGSTIVFGFRQSGAYYSDIYAVRADGSGQPQPVAAEVDEHEIEPAVAPPAPAPVPCTQQTIELLGGSIQAEGCFAHHGAAWLATGLVRVNGVDFNAAGTITIDPAAARLRVEGQVTVSVGDVTLLVTDGLDWSLRVEVHLSLGQNFTLKGFPIEGEATIGWSGGEATMKLGVKLPDVLGGFSATAELSANNRDGIKLEEMSVGVEHASILGRLELKSLLVTYTRAEDQWSGEATVVLPTPYSIEVTAKLVLQHGQFSSGSVSATTGWHIANGIYLRSISFSVDTDPLVLTGAAELTAGPEVDGHAIARLAGSLTYTFADPDVIKVSGNLKVADDIELAQGSMEYRSTGRLSVDGHLGFEKLGVGVTGDIEGWIDGTEAFNIEGDVVVDADLFTLGGHAIVSSVGMAACGTLETWLGDVSVGVGYKWHQDPEFLSGCDLGPYRQDGLQFSDESGSFDVAEGLPVVALAV